MEKGKIPAPCLKFEEDEMLDISLQNKTVEIVLKTKIVKLSFEELKELVSEVSYLREINKWLCECVAQEKRHLK